MEYAKNKEFHKLTDDNVGRDSKFISKVHGSSNILDL